MTDYMQGKEQYDHDETKNIQSREAQEAANRKQADYQEETAAEFAPDYSVVQDDAVQAGTMERMLGYSALVLAVLSIFFMPVFLGTAAVVLAIPAIYRGVDRAGGWALGIALTVLLFHLTIFPFI